MYPLFFPPQLAATAPHVIAAPECFRTEVDYADTCRRYAGYGGERVFRRPRPCRYCGDPGLEERCDCSEDPNLEPGDVEVSIYPPFLICYYAPRWRGGVYRRSGGEGGRSWDRYMDGLMTPLLTNPLHKVIAFQIQLYELGLDAEWIRKQVAFRGMESRERLRYEFDGTERFFTDGIPSTRALPTGPVAGNVLKSPLVHSTPKPPPLAHSAPKPPSLAHNVPKSPPKLLLQQHPQQQQRQQQQQQQQQQTSPLQRPPPLVRRESRLRYMETYEASENATARRADNKDEVLVMLGTMRLGDAEKDAVGKADLEPASTKRTNRRRRGKNRAVYP